MRVKVDGYSGVLTSKQTAHYSEDLTESKGTDVFYRSRPLAVRIAEDTSFPRGRSMNSPPGTRWWRTEKFGNGVAGYERVHRPAVPQVKRTGNGTEGEAIWLALAGPLNPQSSLISSSMGLQVGADLLRNREAKKELGNIPTAL